MVIAQITDTHIRRKGRPLYGVIDTAEHLRPTVIFMHHPPFQTGIRAMDALGFIGVERFGDIVERLRQIERIVAGHIHRSMQVQWKGTIASVAPSTAYQLVLAQRSQKPLGFSLEPPGFALHVWTGEAMLTHTVAVDRKKNKDN
jgi:Icc-related predicted phosphoesterase